VTQRDAAPHDHGAASKLGISSDQSAGALYSGHIVAVSRG